MGSVSSELIKDIFGEEKENKNKTNPVSVNSIIELGERIKDNQQTSVVPQQKSGNKKLNVTKNDVYFHVFNDVENGEVVVIPATKTPNISMPSKLSMASKISVDDAIKRYKETGEYYEKFVDNKNKKQTASGKETLSSALGLNTKTALQQAEEYVEQLKREQYKEALKSGTATDNSYNFFDKLEIKREAMDEQIKERIQEDAESIAEIPVLSSVASVVTNVLDGLSALSKSVNALGGYETRGVDNLSVMTSTIRQKRGEAWDKALGTEKSGVGSFVYSGLMAIADMATAILLSKGVAASSVGNIEKATKGISQFVMSSQAASQTMTQAKERGLSGTQVFSLGVASAAIEALTEKYSLDALFSDPKNWATHILKNVVTEASEEAVSNVLNTIADEKIAGNKSVLKQQIFELMANGESYEDATQKVFLSKLEEVGLDALMGGLVGGVMGGASAIINKSNITQYSVPSSKSQSIEDAKAWVTDKFQKQKGEVSVNGLGTVYVNSENSVEAIQSAKNADQAVMFLALNTAIKKGDVITPFSFESGETHKKEAQRLRL